MTNVLNQANVNTDADMDARRRIVSETDQNFFVEAGAGSGKTTLLVRRMVAMVEQGKNIQQICAITFTKAAAGEFYDRFRKLLIKRSQPEAPGEEPDRFLPPTTPESRKYCEEALKDIDLSFMGTIDSFCGRILGEHPVEAGLPSELSLISDEELEAYLRQAYVRISHGEFGGDKAAELKAYANLLRQLHRQPEEVFACGARYLLEHRNAEFHFEMLDAASVENKLKGFQEEVSAAVRALMQHPEKLPDKPTVKGTAAWQNIQENEQLLTGSWKYRYGSVLYLIGNLTELRITCDPEDIGFSRGDLFDDWTRKTKSGEKLLGAEVKADNALLRRMHSLPYDLALSFLTVALPVVEAELKERGAMTYFDYLYDLRNMLRDDAAKGGKLAEYIAKAHQYFLIDEFQDTDPLQAEVFFYLSAKEPKENWAECCPREGSLFIVGDPKQSIYRFRNADVTSFLRVKALFEDANVGEVLTLSRNFRSTKILREYFNRTFQKILPLQTEVQSRFEAIPLEEDASSEGWSGIYRYTAYMGKACEDHPEESDEKQVGRIIRQLSYSDEYQIWDKEKNALRRLKYGDFMLITATKSVLGKYSQELERLGIPYRVEGNVPFAECPSLQAVSEIYSAAANPKNGIAVYRALKGTLVHLEEEGIKAYRAAGGKLEIPFGDDAVTAGNSRAPARVAKACSAMEKLRDLVKKSAELSPAALFRHIANEYRVFEKTGGQNAEIFWYVEEQLRARETAVLRSHRDAALWLETLLAGESEEERCLSFEERLDAVHLANLHKVKGLEAPIVILGASSLPDNKGADNRIEYGSSSTEGYLFRLKQGTGYTKTTLIQTARYQDRESDEAAALAAERDRTLYVAATRAENALIICESVSRGRGRSNSEVINTRWESLIEEATPYLKIKADSELPDPAAGKQPVQAEDLYAKAEQADAEKEDFVSEDSFRLQTPSSLELLSVLEDSEVKTEDAPEADQDASGSGVVDRETAAESKCPAKEKSADPFGLHHRLAATLGTMTHRLMEMLVSSGFRLEVDKTVQEILCEYGGNLSSLQLQALQEALRSVGQTMLAGGYPQENGKLQDLFAELKTAEEIHCELPFTCREDAVTSPLIWDGVMDLVYKKDGKWSIVDYKTNADGTDLDIHYQNQLEAYKKAFLAMTGEEAEVRVYHIAV